MLYVKSIIGPYGWLGYVVPMLYVKSIIDPYGWLGYVVPMLYVKSIIDPYGWSRDFVRSHHIFKSVFLCYLLNPLSTHMDGRGILLEAIIYSRVCFLFLCDIVH